MPCDGEATGGPGRRTAGTPVCAALRSEGDGLDLFSVIVELDSAISQSSGRVTEMIPRASLEAAPVLVFAGRRFFS